MKIGLDFGTTNSVLSYWDEKANEPRVFSYDNNTYTPTILAWDKFDDKVYGIGIEARNKWDNNPGKYTLFQTFKTLLTEKDQKIWTARGWDNSKNPEEITKYFIEWLLQKSSGSFEKNNAKITNLVVSVPEVWQKETINEGAAKLQKVTQELGLPLQQLVSEPLAAVAYYIWKNKLKDKEEKKILVCDMGGGTFDVSWCKATKNTIEVLHFEGNDKDLAGMYHLREIIRNALKRAGRQLGEDTAEFKKLVWRLETYIRGDQEQINLERNFLEFQKDARSWDIELEQLNGLPIYTGGVFKAFGAIHTGIQEVLNALDKKVNNMKTFDQVLLVGGFSEYFLIRKTILDYFQLKEGDNKVRTVSRQDSYLAIAHGAALLSAGQVKIIERYPHSIYYNTKTLDNQDLDLEIVKAGQTIDEQRQIFSSRKVKVFNKTFTLSGFVCPNGIKKNPFKFKKKIALEDINLAEDQEYKVGIEINRSNIATFILEDQSGKVHRCSIDALFDDKSIFVIS